jgi:hypothetical protein
VLLSVVTALRSDLNGKWAVGITRTAVRAADAGFGCITLSIMPLDISVSVAWSIITPASPTLTDADRSLIVFANGLFSGKFRIRLKTLVADQALANAILKEAAKGNFQAPSEVAAQWTRYVANWGPVKFHSGLRVGYLANQGRHSAASRVVRLMNAGCSRRYEALPSVAIGWAVRACIASCEPMVGT